MNTKKYVLLALIGFIVSGIFFGTIWYFAFYRNIETTTQKTVKTYEYTLGDFTTNLNSTRSYFKGTVVVETTDKELVAKLPEKNNEIRDGVIQVLISKKQDDLLDLAGQEKLRQEIKDVVKRIMNSDEITNVYFIDYIIQ